MNASQSQSNLENSDERIDPSISLPAIPELPETSPEIALPSAGQIRSGRLAGLSMSRAIWVLAFPILLQQLLLACVGLADKMLAGRLPDDLARDGLDAVGVGSYIGWLTGIAMSGLGVGGQILIARGMGRGDRQLAHRALGRACALSVVWGAAVGAMLLVLAKPMAHWSGLHGQSEEFCEQYVMWLALAMPFTGFAAVGEMCMFGAGETLAPSRIALWVNLVNIAASWALSGVDVHVGQLVINNPFSFDLHVSGIAMGTALSSVVGALLTFRVLRKGMKDLRLEFADLGLDVVMVKRICRLGLPTFAEGLAMWGVNACVLYFICQIELKQNIAGGLQGAHIIAVQWESFSFLPGFAIGIAAGSLTGQYLGAGNPRQAARAIIACATIAGAIMGTLGLVFIFCGRWLTTFVSTEPLHLEQAPDLLRICGAIQIFFALTMVMRQGLRGAGDTLWTLVITAVSSYGIRLPLAYVLGVVMNLGLRGIWLGLCGELVVRGLLFTGRFIHGGWKRVRV